MKPDEKKIRATLEKWKYKPTQVDGTVTKLLAMDPAILEAFSGWLDTEVLPDTPVYERFNPKLIYEIYQFKPPACFLMLDWLRLEPVKALNALVHEFGGQTLEKRLPAVNPE